MDTAPQVEIACCLALTDALVRHYLTPLARHPLVKRLWVIRARACPPGMPEPVTHISADAPAKALGWIKMMRTCRRLARRPELVAFVSFNPIPYGLFAAAFAHRHGKAMHFGFIGSDWYSALQRFPWRMFAPCLRRGDLVTTPGELMRDEMLGHGFPAARTSVLHHAIDTARFPPGDPAAARYDCVFVGSLIRRKRVDLILRAFARVRLSHPDATLCLVGDGPERERLKALAAELNVGGSVEFAGHQEDVSPVLAMSRIALIASEREGFPFALVEAMCAGLVPVATAVGCNADYVRHGENGFLVQPGDDEALGDHISMLLADPARHAAMRGKALLARDEFALARAEAFWDPWLRQWARERTGESQP